MNFASIAIDPDRIPSEASRLVDTAVGLINNNFVNPFLDHASARTADASPSPLVLLQNRIKEHENWDGNRGLISNAFASGMRLCTREDERTLVHLRELEQSQTTDEQIRGAIDADRQATGWREEVCRYGSSFLQTVPLFIPGKRGMALSALMHGAEHVRIGTSLPHTATDFALGMLNGAAVQFGMQRVGSSTLPTWQKGALLGLGTGLADNMLSSSTWYDHHHGQWHLEQGAQRTLCSTLLNGATSAAVFPLGHKLFEGVAGSFGTTLTRSPVLTTIATGGSFGFASGTTGEAIRQVSEGGPSALLEPTNWLKILGRGGVQSLSDLGAARVGHGIGSGARTNLEFGQSQGSDSVSTHAGDARVRSASTEKAGKPIQELSLQELRAMDLRQLSPDQFATLVNTYNPSLHKEAPGTEGYPLKMFENEQLTSLPLRHLQRLTHEQLESIVVGRTYVLDRVEGCNVQFDPYSFRMSSFQDLSMSQRLVLQRALQGVGEMPQQITSMGELLQQATESVKALREPGQPVVVLGRGGWPLVAALRESGCPAQYFIWSRLQAGDASTIQQWRKEVPPGALVIDTQRCDGTTCSAVADADPLIADFRYLSSPGCRELELPNINSKHVPPANSFNPRNFQREFNSNLRNNATALDQFPNLMRGRGRGYDSSGHAVFHPASIESQVRFGKGTWAMSSPTIRLFNSALLREAGLSSEAAQRYSNFTGILPEERLGLSDNEAIIRHYREVERLRAQ